VKRRVVSGLGCAMNGAFVIHLEEFKGLQSEQRVRKGTQPSDGPGCK
jgi:hypothetical protein